MKSFLWIIALIIGPYVIAKTDIWRKNKLSEVWAWWQAEAMPKELQTSTLFLCEKDIRTRSPVALHGRPDQVFKTRQSKLIPVDTKSRSSHKVYASDIIQLSVYRVILSHLCSEPVSGYGYVRTVVETHNGESVRYIKVWLYSENEIVQLWHRYQAIRCGRQESQCSCGGIFHS